MNLQNNSNRTEKDLQEVMETWDKKILPHLPQQLEELAKQTGILQRKRGIHSAVELLKIWFLYACSHLSFRMLACAAYALGISTISDTAWRKHFSGAVPFLQEVLHSILSSFLPFQTDAVDLKKIKEVLLVDASIVRQEGKQQNQQRIHMCYSLNHNQMQQVKVTNKYTPESLTHFSLKKGDLVLADAGYGIAHNYIYAQEHQADVILRITPKCFCLYDADGTKISLLSLLKQAEEKYKETVNIFGFCNYRTKSAFVRVIAQKLPKEEAEKSRKRKKRKASKNQYQVTEDTLFYAGWMMVITSLGIEYSEEEILHLYRSRWQVELLFKRLKQNFSMHTIKAGSTNYAEAEVLLWLILWVITERQSLLGEYFHSEKKETIVFSVYEKSKLVFLQIKEMVCLSWSLFLDFTDETYLRYLSIKKRRRRNQNEEFHTAILSGLLA